MPDSKTDQLAAAFCERSLPKDQWTHEAHLRVGLWHLLRHPSDTALTLLRERISEYNVASGTENTDDSGYHETITRFFVIRIAQFVATADRTRPIDDLAAELILLLGDPRAPLEFYSRERLMSVEARRGWVEPDVRPLTSPCASGPPAAPAPRAAGPFV
jgi:hypothetical protein